MLWAYANEFNLDRLNADALPGEENKGLAANPLLTC
jgi:hypothetical protein